VHDDGIKLFIIGGFSMSIKRTFFSIIMPVVLAIPCLYYLYIRAFNPVIASLTSESLQMRLEEGQRSFNYVIYGMRYEIFIVFAVYMIVLLFVLIIQKVKTKKD
jgi:hypothetical protein